jgi:hypothetical protein
MRYITLVFVLIATVSYGQTIIRGMVVDSASFHALPYVNVHVKGTLRGTTTDVKGSFSLQATELDTLIFTLVGYRTLEYPLFAYEPSMIRMAEQPTVLAPVTIHDSRISANPYEGMFDDQNARLKKRIPFYYHKTRKDKIKAANWREEVARVQTYVDVVINDPDTKNELIKKYTLSEKEYYDLMALFNEKHYRVMYYLTKGELISLINQFFDAYAPWK